ncbi:hypothetical protein [Arthrobacter rhombi]|uniref:Uncharacterized protein n=1 Tax=Arthrobacter rhombi TaxID=71253 RepID=A0A1R4F2D6_9MICC|nr:hypothetical protein [Arthrobacter rhombi]SJM49983.1 hypothetical protein FM101_01870 [Arthrobacter rhombi]
MANAAKMNHVEELARLQSEYDVLRILNSIARIRGILEPSLAQKLREAINARLVEQAGTDDRS